MKKKFQILALLLLTTANVTLLAAEKINPEDYQRAMWHPIHFPPAIDSANDAQCLACHQEILEHKVYPNYQPECQQIPHWRGIRH